MGLVTSTATAILPASLLSLMSTDAHAALECPTVASDRTGFVTIRASGGCNQMSMFWPVDPNGIALASATDVTTSGAKWGISSANDAFQLAKGQIVNGSDIFWAAMRLAPTGLGASGGLTAQQVWDRILSTNVTFSLLMTSSNDDTSNDQRGGSAGVALAKGAQVATELNANIGSQYNNAESGINGAPTRLSVGATTASLSGAVSFPAATLTSGGPSGLMQITEKYSGQLRTALTGSLMAGRRALAGIDTLFRCAEPDAVKNADVVYGLNLFTPGQQPEMQTGNAANVLNFTPTGLTQPQQTEMMIAFRSCTGTILSGALQTGGSDYHGTNPGTISNVHLDLAEKIKYTILGMILSGEKGMINFFTDGSAVASGTDPAVGNPNAGVVPNATAPTARNDSGGTFGTMHVLIFVAANAAQLPTPKHIGSFTATGDVLQRGSLIGSDFRYATAATLLTLARFNGDPNAVTRLLAAFTKAGNPVKLADVTTYTAIA